MFYMRAIVTTDNCFIEEEPISIEFVHVHTYLVTYGIFGTDRQMHLLNMLLIKLI